MTPSIKKIREKMLLAVAAIDSADQCELFFRSIPGKASEQIIADGHTAAGKAIAEVIDTVVSAVDNGGMDVLTRRNTITGNKHHSVIIAPTLERYAAQ